MILANINTKHITSTYSSISTMGTPEKAFASAGSGGDDTPPAYFEAMGESAGPSAASAQPSTSALALNNSDLPPLLATCASPLYHPFPSVLTVKYQLKMTRTYHLGDDANRKMFAVSNFEGLASRGPDRGSVVLYNGSSDKDPALAAAGEISRPAVTRALNSVVNISALPGSDEAKMGKAATKGFRAGLSDDGKTVIFRFAIEVGGEKSGHLVLEEFEWRSTPKQEVHAQGYMYEFNLFRLGSTDEILARASWKRFASWSKPFMFEFLGSGNEGGLGERWSVMALITGMRIWFLDQGGRASKSHLDTCVSYPVA